MPYALAAPVHSELIIKKSRFIGCVQPMPDRASAQAHVDALWKEHPGATHICWALLAGGQSAAVDDGELGAHKVALQRLAHLHCSLPYALEGTVRRELAAAGAHLESAAHASDVRLHFTLPEAAAPALVQRLANLSHGAITCSNLADEPQTGD